MPADTRTQNLGAVQMATGNDNNNWGDNFNSDILAPLEKAICGAVLRTVTGGTLDLSANPPPTAVNQAIEFCQAFTGTLTADQTVIVPNVFKTWLFQNATAGNFVLLVKTPNGSPICIPQGTEKFVMRVGSDVLLRLDRHDVGEVRDFAGASVPPGTLECDGSAISRTRFPDLFAKIGTTWGIGDGSTTFNLPNLKDTGRFRRSRAGAVVVGTYQANQVGSHSHAAGTLGGTTDSAGSHSHGGATSSVGNHSHGGVTGGAGAHGHGGTALSAGAHAHTVGGGSGQTDTQGSHNHTGSTSAQSVDHTHNVDLGLVASTIAVQLGSTNINQVVAGANVKPSGGESIGHGHSISTDGAHGHAVTIDSGGAHTHSITVDPAADHVHGIGGDGAHQHAISADGAHGHNLTITGSTASTGGGDTRPEAAVFISCIRY